ncbi:MAG TPA: RcnB family protein [Rhizomicrobium sp.]|jgi:Ni/Co efflux regulator RcnB|nr:RcnB family protein [Rhizomicrobium sp.]
MKYLLFCALAACFAAPAMADPPDHRDQRSTIVQKKLRETPERRVVHTRSEGPHRTVTETRKVTPRRKVITHETSRHHVTTVHRKVVTHRHPGVAHFHRVVRAPHRFHIRAWIAPRGFHYRRFRLGERIPRVLLAADFFLTSYWLYGLDPPPPDYVWVRDGPDAVLVDRYTGEVIQVVYDVFY